MRLEALCQEETEIHETLKLGSEENEKKRQSVDELEAVIHSLSEEEIQGESSRWKAGTAIKDEKNTSHKAFFEKRDELSR